MNIKYLNEVVIPQREREFAEGKNLGTRDPIYVVYSLRDQYVSGHSDYSPTTNLKGKNPDFGYLYKRPDWDEPQFCLNEDGSDLDVEEWETHDEDGMPYTDSEPESEEATRLWVDHLEAIFLTSKAAYDYIQYQAHNLTNPYVYVHCAGYRNYEMDMLLTTPPTPFKRLKKWVSRMFTKAKR